MVQAWLASRGLIALVALLLRCPSGARVSTMVSNWDVQHFGELAAGGYFCRPDRDADGVLPRPAGAAAGRAGDRRADPGHRHVLIATLGSILAAAALARLGGPWAAVAWLFAPTAVFTTVPYTESLFCAAAFWAWERARSDRWLGRGPARRGWPAPSGSPGCS